MPLKVVTAQAQLPCAAERTPVLRVFVRSGIIPDRAGRQTSFHRHPAASSMAEAQPSPAQAIDFLTLLQNLKVVTCSKHENKHIYIVKSQLQHAEICRKQSGQAGLERECLVLRALQTICTE